MRIFFLRGESSRQQASNTRRNKGERSRRSPERSTACPKSGDEVSRSLAGLLSEGSSLVVSTA